MVKQHWCDVSCLQGIFGVTYLYSPSVMLALYGVTVMVWLHCRSVLYIYNTGSTDTDRGQNENTDPDLSHVIGGEGYFGQSRSYDLCQPLWAYRWYNHRIIIVYWYGTQPRRGIAVSICNVKRGGGYSDKHCSCQPDVIYNPYTAELFVSTFNLFEAGIANEIYSFRMTIFFLFVKNYYLKK